MNYFKNLGIMLDCSRNAVMNISELKKFIKILNGFGYNRLFLYTEETYEVDGEEYFGYLRGRFTKEELKELDGYAYGLGIELVPCIQTLAHLECALRWKKYSNICDCADVLLTEDERTYELIDNMLKTLRSCFRSNNIHLGMDEAWELGRGKYLDKHGYKPKSEILLPHIERVCKIAEKYGYTPMIWGDMFFKLSENADYYTADAKIPDELKNSIPENLSLVYWDYYQIKQENYERCIDKHKALTDKICFAGGLWKWTGFAPHNRYSHSAVKASLSACINKGIDSAFFTMWGDNGAECSPYALLPSICYAACFANGITKKADIEKKFKAVIGYNYNDFMLLDLPNRLIPENRTVNPCKYLLYNDCFMSIYENGSTLDAPEKYRKFARQLSIAKGKTGEYGYLFDTLSKLCKVLELKANICTETRKVYESGGKEELAKLINKYGIMIKRTKAFYKAFKFQWEHDNKPHGFDVEDIRLGGLIYRMTACKNRLNDLLNGKITEIPELNEKLLPALNGVGCVNDWAKNVTANVI